MNNKPFISIIIPVYNASQHLGQCLGAIASSSYSCYEIIVVDDGSTDDSSEIAYEMGAVVFRLPKQSGPAAARNYGSQQAKGGILFFVDSDVLIKEETIERLVDDFNQYPDIAAIFGSYDDSPAEKNFLSQYKNLFHHFVHQHSNSDAATFWAGCGAIRREAFQKVGGFDQHRYPKPTIEDIELGYRMKSLGYGIMLDKDLQVKHLKQWRIGSLLRADIFYRAVPWSNLIIESKDMIEDLNLQKSHKISAGLVALLAGTLLLSIFKPQLLLFTLPLLTGIFLLNYEFYKFFSIRKGLNFATLAFHLHLLYYFYSGMTFVLCRAIYVFSGKKMLYDSRSLE